MVHYYVAALEVLGWAVFAPGEPVGGAGCVVCGREGWGHGSAVDGGEFEEVVVYADCCCEDPEGCGGEGADWDILEGGEGH